MATKTAKQILEGLGDRDPDLREMAARDLEKGLQTSEIKLASAEEQQLVSRFIEMTAKDQTLKVLASHSLVDMLSKSSTPANVAAAVPQLVQNLLSNHEEDEKTIREVSTYALKGLITGSQPTFDPTLIHDPLLSALQSKNTKVTEYALDVLDTLLTQWGSTLVEDPNGERVFEAIQSVALPHLQSHVYNIQTKAIGCVGNLGAFLSYSSFVKLIEELVGNLKIAATNADCSNACTTLTSLSTICRLSGVRFSHFLETLLPLISIFVQAEEFTDEAEQVKVCEAALTTLETIVIYCGTSAASHYDAIQEHALQFIAYDPTVLEGDDDADDNADGADGADGAEFEYDDEGGADETETWRVRKACIRCISAIAQKTQYLGTFFTTVVEELIRRFTDSQENVKIEVFRAFSGLVGLVHSSADQALRGTFLEWIPSIVGGLTKQFKVRGDKSKIEAFSLIFDIAAAAPGAFDEHIGKLVPGLVSSLKNRSENLRAEASKALRGLALHSGKPHVFHPYVGILVPALITAINTKNFKVTASALRAAAQLASVLPGKETAIPLYDSAYAILTQDNAALEVKDAVISSCGQLVALHGDQLGGKVADTLKLLGDRLNHATTAVAAAKAIQAVAASSGKSLLAGQETTLTRHLVDSLKLNNRQVRHAALEALTTVITTTGIELEGVDALVTYIDADDLLIAGLTFKVLAIAVQTHPNIVPDVVKYVVPKSLEVLKHPATQGGAVVALAGTLKAVVEAKPDQFDGLFSALNSLHGLETGSQISSVAQILGAIIEGHAQGRDAVIKKYLSEAKSGSLLAISTLGEVGSRIDLTKVPGAVEVLVGLLGTSLSSSAGFSDKSVRYTAARALGSVAVGNPGVIIEVMAGQISKTPQYAVIAIRQMVERLPPDAIAHNSSHVLKLLLNASVKADETVRDSISDCIGKLVQSNPLVVEVLVKAVTSDSKITRACVIRAISLAVNQGANAKILEGSLVHFLDGIKDPELEVRTAALGLLHTCVVKNLTYVASVIPGYAPALAVEAKRRNELITKVTVGNNVLVTDLGLPSRRLTFQIFDGLLSSAPERLDLSSLLQSVAGGAKGDEEVEIQIQSHKIVVKLATHHPEITLKHVGQFDLMPVFLKVLPNTAIDVDIKANNDLVASALQVIHAIEDQLYSNKYLSTIDTFVAAEALVKAGFGGLRAERLYRLIVTGLSELPTQGAAVKVLTELWKIFDTKLVNNLAHKPIADDIISGLDPVLVALKTITTSKDESFVKAVLGWVRVTETAFTRLEKHKKDMKVNSHPGFNNFLNNTIKKGPLATQYAEIK